MTTRLDQDCLIDVSEEDDSLLPNGDKSTQRNDDSLLHSVDGEKEPMVKNVGLLEESLPLSQSVCSADKGGSLALAIICEVPPVAKKKKKSGFNVRKSMAWDRAFLTNEGVLDAEELSLVNKTFPKFYGLTKQSKVKKSMPTSECVKPPLMPQTSLRCPKLVPNPESNKHLFHSDLNSLPQSRETLIALDPTKPKGINCHKNKATPSLSCGDMVTVKKEYADCSEPKPPLVRMFTDKNVSASNHHTAMKGTQLKHTVNNSGPLGPTTDVEAGRPLSTTFIAERFASASTLQPQPRTSSLKCESSSSSSKARSSLTKFSPSEASGALMSRDKPSGLRMPSPKLGFFDMSKTVPQVSSLHGRVSSHAYRGSGPVSDNAAQVEVKARGLNHSKHTGMSPGLGCELGETFRNHRRVTKALTRIPMAPVNAQLASLELAPRNESPRPASHSPHTVNRAQRSVHSKHNGNAVMRRMPANSKSKERENLSPNFDKDTCMPQKCPLAVDRATEDCPIQGHSLAFKSKGQESVS